MTVRPTTSDRATICDILQYHKVWHTLWCNALLIRVRLMPITRSPAVARIADRTGCQWPSRWSKVDDFQIIWKPICDFLLVATLAISLAISEIRPFIAGNIPFKSAAKPLQMETWLLFTTYKKSAAPYPMVPLSTPYNLPFGHNTARLAYHSALWPFKVIRGHRFFMSFEFLKANMRFSISDQ